MWYALRHWSRPAWKSSRRRKWRRWTDSRRHLIRGEHRRSSSSRTLWIRRRNRLRLRIVSWNNIGRSMNEFNEWCIRHRPWRLLSSICIPYRIKWYKGYMRVGTTQMSWRINLKHNSWIGWWIGQPQKLRRLWMLRSRWRWHSITNLMDWLLLGNPMIRQWINGGNDNRREW